MDLLQSITWKQFITWLTIAFLIYYAAAIILLIKQWWKNAKAAKNRKVFWQPTLEELKETISEEIQKPDQEQDENVDPASDASLPKDESLIIRFGHDLQELIEANRHTKDKQVILNQLVPFLSAYQELNAEPMRRPLTTVIQKRFKEECDIELLETEIQSIWNDPLQKNTGSVVG